MKTESKPAPARNPANSGPAIGPKHPFLWAFLTLVGILVILFHDSFRPGFVIFSNDGPLGAMMQELNKMPSALKGLWLDLVWLGSESTAPPASISSALRLLASPMVYEKILCPTAILIGGLGAFYCFRRLRLSPWACILGSLAAAMNSDFFSTSCWGVSTQVIGFGAMFAAIGFLAEPEARWSWLRVILAGMAVGVGVMEAYDIGALFSLFVAGYVVYQTMFMTAKPEGVPVKIGRSALRGFMVAAFAGLIATHTLTSLVGTQIKGIAGAQQDEQIKAFEWAQKTAWSVPTREILQVMVPGVFGYRMQWHMYENDQPKDDRYWGAAPTPVGTGYYAGVLVVLVAIWAIVQSFRTRGSPFTIFQRRAIWFWTMAFIIAALLAFGKNAPFYQFLYGLPYFSTIRNPQKFMHIFSWALIIVFGYGVHGLTTAYMQKPVALADGMMAQFKSWRAKAEPFDRKWLNGCIGAIAASLVIWLLYAASNGNVQAHLESTGLKHEDAVGVASFSLRAVGWFVILLAVATGLLALIFSGQFSGARSRWGGIALGAFLLLDLGRADAPWIVYWDTNYKYASDPIINFLAEKPYGQRVSFMPMGFYIPIIQNLTAGDDAKMVPWQQQLAMMQNAYNSAWKQNLFPAHNIQCIDDIQEPRAGVDKRTLQAALPENTGGNILRWWALSNTRYLLGPGPVIVKQMDPDGKFLHVLKSFDLQPKRANPNFAATEDWVSVENPDGHLAVIEYKDALPRAKLFSQWQVITNDEATLAVMANPTFNPNLSVLISDPIASPIPANGGKDPGTVEVSLYRSKRVEMKADVKVPSVLLLTDRYNANWKAEVDGKPATILRANFITRGVYLEPGKHTVVMRYVPPLGTLWVSLAFIAIGLFLWGFVAWTGAAGETASPKPEAKMP